MHPDRSSVAPQAKAVASPDAAGVAGVSGAAPAVTASADSAGPFARLRVALADIKLAHTVFAMPFAVLGGVMAISSSGLTVGGVAVALGLVVVAMVFARTWAMLVNRLADWRFDAANERTAGRAIAAGRLGVRDGWTIAIVAAVGFVATAGSFGVALGNWWPAILSVPVLGWVALYSYTKRFTALAHFFLGSALAISPVCAAVAVSPEVLGLSPTVVVGGSASLEVVGAGAATPPWADTGAAVLLLAGFVGLWVAGFDIAYALQDVAFDRDRGLRSIPARLGMRGSQWASRACHAAAFALLVASGMAEPRFGAAFAFAVVAVGGLLIYEHLVLARRGLAGLPVAFFTVNGVVSCVLGAAGVIDVWLV